MIPPHSLEAEESVLGACLVHPGVLAEAAAVVKPADFYHPLHAAAFAAMVELADEQKPVDVLTVSERMREDGKTAPDLAELMCKVVTVSNVAYHARIVRQKAERRRTVHILRELAAAGLGDEGDAEYRERVQSELLALIAQQPEGRAAGLKQVVKEAVANVEKRYENRGAVTGIPTGYHALDGMLTGLQAGDLVIVAGRPSMGKSALAFNVVLNAAFQGVSGLVFSLEMGRASIGERMLSTDGPIEGMRLRSGRLERADWVKMTNAGSRLAALPVVIDDSGTITIADIRARARRWAAQATGRRLVVVDYLQLVAGEQKRGGNREQEIASISRGLKQLAKELDAPVLALSQLSRDLERRSDKRPIMSDLRESGAIEQDADVIAFVYRDEVYCDDCKQGNACSAGHEGIAEVIVGKQRNGPLGTVKLDWQASYSRFANRLAPEGRA